MKMYPGHQRLLCLLVSLSQLPRGRSWNILCLVWNVENLTSTPDVNDKKWCIILKLDQSNALGRWNRIPLNYCTNFKELNGLNQKFSPCFCQSLMSQAILDKEQNFWHPVWWKWGKVNNVAILWKKLVWGERTRATERFPLSSMHNNPMNYLCKQTVSVNGGWVGKSMHNWCLRLWRSVNRIIVK